MEGVYLNIDTYDYFVILIRKWTYSFTYYLIAYVITVNYFCVHHKNRQKPNEHSKLLFLKIDLHFGTSD